ncbi:MAG: hypothetical protein LKG25_00760 [Prevotella sp.]|jgi:hypothetical protein|nr:hypothetical protein [Prevotella sp.]MCI1281107.1 hypothetical protein [Prevotella sp.]
MKSFKIKSLEETKYVVDLSAMVDVEGDCYEVTMKYINPCDGNWSYELDGSDLPLDKLTIMAINRAIIDLHEKQGIDEEKART